MKKLLAINIMLLGIFLLAGCSQQDIKSTPTEQQSRDNKDVGVNPEKKIGDQKKFSYCKPDEDPGFILTNEDDLFYYYTGNKAIEGVLYQQSPNSPITFETKIDQSCKFEITKKFVSNSNLVKEAFHIDNAWENKPNCGVGEQNAYLDGVYTILVKGFKVSKTYIQQYNPSRMIDKLHMNRYSFYLDYDKIEKVGEESQVKCQRKPIIDPGPDFR